MNINSTIFFTGLVIFTIVIGIDTDQDTIQNPKYPDAFLKKLVFYAKKARNRTENLLDEDDGSEYFHQFYSGYRDTDLDKFILQKEKEKKTKSSVKGQKSTQSWS